MIYELNARNASANAVASLVAAGTANATPRILIKTSTGTVLATLLMSATPFGAASNGTITAGAIQADTNAATNGTMARFEVTNRDNQLVLSGSITATGGGGDMTSSRLAVSQGDTVSIGTFTITVTAGT